MKRLMISHLREMTTTNLTKIILFKISILYCLNLVGCASQVIEEDSSLSTEYINSEVENMEKYNLDSSRWKNILREYNTSMGDPDTSLAVLLYNNYNHNDFEGFTDAKRAQNSFGHANSSHGRTPTSTMLNTSRATATCNDICSPDTSHV
jgi:hypothetical protein